MDFVNNDIRTRVEKAILSSKKYNKEQIIELLSKQGYTISENALLFLEEVGGIKIYFENLMNGIKKDDINFDINNAIELESSEKVFEDYNLRIDKNLCIIGTAFRDHIILLMADDGMVYGGYDNFFCKIANSGSEAIEKIILGQPFEEISKK